MTKLLKSINIPSTRIEAINGNDPKFSDQWNSYKFRHLNPWK